MNTTTESPREERERTVFKTQESLKRITLHCDLIKAELDSMDVAKSRVWSEYQNLTETTCPQSREKERLQKKDDTLKKYHTLWFIFSKAKEQITLLQSFLTE